MRIISSLVRVAVSLAGTALLVGCAGGGDPSLAAPQFTQHCQLSPESAPGVLPPLGADG